MFERSHSASSRSRATMRPLAKSRRVERSGTQEAASPTKSNPSSTAAFATCVCSGMSPRRAPSVRYGAPTTPLTASA